MKKKLSQDSSLIFGLELYHIRIRAIFIQQLIGLVLFGSTVRKDNYLIHTISDAHTSCYYHDRLVSNMLENGLLND